MTAHCPDHSCYDSADHGPVTSLSFSQEMVTEGRMARALLGCRLPSAPCGEGSCSLVAASTEGEACPSPCCDTSWADCLALTGSHMSFRRKGWTVSWSSRGRNLSQEPRTAILQVLQCPLQPGWHQEHGLRKTSVTTPRDGGAQPPDLYHHAGALYFT